MRKLYFLAIAAAVCCACLAIAAIGGCKETRGEAADTPPPRAAEQPTSLRDNISEEIRKGQQATLPGN